MANINDDGWLDLFKPTLDGPSPLYLSRCGEEAWLRIALEQDGLNRHGIGAKIRLTAAGRTQVGTIRAGGTSLASSGPPEVHFGLGDLDTVDRVEIWWPDSSVTTLEDLATRQVLTIVK